MLRKGTWWSASVSGSSPGASSVPFPLPFFSIPLRLAWAALARLVRLIVRFARELGDQLDIRRMVREPVHVTDEAIATQAKMLSLPGATGAMADELEIVVPLFDDHAARHGD